MKSEPPYKAVAVGAGYFSRFQYEAWSRIPEVRMLAICNRTESRARPLMDEFSIPRYYDDFAKMLDQEQPDFVDIITPPETHHAYCEIAARAGVDIICQKPLAPTYEQSKAIVDMAERHGVRFMVHENWRWQPWYRAAKQIQQQQLIGRFTHFSFRMRTGDGWPEDAYMARQPFFREYPKLLIYETGVHFIDTFRYLLGEVTSVYAKLRRLNPAIKGEDTGQVFFTFDSGATAILDANRYNEADTDNPRYTFGTMRIDGGGGHLELDLDSTIRIKPLGEPSRVHDYPRENINFAGDCCYHLQRHFVDCYQSGEPFESHGEDYLRTLRIVDAVYESAASDEVVRID